MNKLLFTLLLVSTSSFANDIGPIFDSTKCKMTYPKGALFNEEQGTVTVRITVNETGKVIQTELLNTSGSKSLDKATLEELKSCSVTPGTINGKASTMTTIVKYAWSFK